MVLRKNKSNISPEIIYNTFVMKMPKSQVVAYFVKKDLETSDKYIFEYFNKD